MERVNESGHEEEIISLADYFSSRQRQTDRLTVGQTDSRTDWQTDIVILSYHPSDTLTSSMPLISRIAPRTRENTPVPRIHSLVRPPFRTEGALSAVINMK